MSIELDKNVQSYLHGSIKRFVAEHLDEEIGDLKAGLFLDFCVREIGPSIYNQALADARVVLHDKIDDIDGALSKPEFVYWKKK